jgi:hypothetical protein
MSPEYIHYLFAVWRASCGGVDYFGSFAEIRGTHDRRRDDGELFHSLAAEIIEAMHCAAGDAQRLPGTNLDGPAVDRPGKDALDTVKDLLVGIVLVGGLDSRSVLDSLVRCSLERIGPTSVLVT